MVQFVAFLAKVVLMLHSDRESPPITPKVYQEHSAAAYLCALIATHAKRAIKAHDYARVCPRNVGDLPEALQPHKSKELEG